MSNRVIYNIEYNLPRVNLSLPARQNRSHDTILRITPGMTEAIEFWFGNIDGVPINLTHFTVKFVAWKMLKNDTIHTSLSQSEVVFSKEVEVQAPYEGKFVMVLSENDTIALARPGSGSLRWSLFMINQDGEVFPGQITQSGTRWGTLVLDLDSGIPISEIIRTLSV
jgi:hypothetical protein